MSEIAEPLVLDVDTGIDDAFALLYACAHDGARILGVSTVVGNVSLAAATRNTRAVLALAGRARALAGREQVGPADAGCPAAGCWILPRPPTNRWTPTIPMSRSIRSTRRRRRCPGWSESAAGGVAPAGCPAAGQEPGR